MPMPSRRSGRLCVLAAAAVLALGSPVAPAAAAPTVLQTADRIMGLSYDAFGEHPRTAPFDWSTDGCTAVPEPLAGRFRDACVQHDFGYRNYGSRGTLRLDPSDARRARIDRRFREEMRRVCADRHDGSDTCLAQADLLYRGVVLFGGASF